MTLLWPFALLSLILIPLLVTAYVLWNRRRSSKSETTLGAGYVEVDERKWTRHMPALFALLALTTIMVGFARPQATVDVPRFRSTVMLTFDTSTSMAADDLEPSRLEAAKAAALSFLETQPDSVDVGIVSFGSQGAITLRPTPERAEVVSAIGRLEPGNGATSLSEGLFSALSAIAAEPIVYLPAEDGSVEIPSVDFGAFGSSIIVLFSDGEDTTEADPTPLADLGAQGGIRVYSIGVGNLDGTTLDIDGFSVSTALQDTLLREIADVSNGTYFLADEQADLAEASKVIERDLTVEEERIEVSSLFAVGGLVLLAIAALFSIVTQRRLP